MIKEKHQAEVRMGSKFVSNKNTLHRSSRFFALFRMPIRRGVSLHVLEIAKRLKKEYQTDLDYLQDH